MFVQKLILKIATKTQINNTLLYIVNYFTEEYIYLLIKIIVKSFLVVNL